MTEKKSEWGDLSLKIIIAIIVPLSIAIIGIFGQMIISQAGDNQLALERQARLLEADTAFRRDLFAELFNEYVDKISEINEPSDLESLATRLELLSSNFSEFLKLRPLFLALDRQINRVLPSEDPARHDYQARLQSSARAVGGAQTAQISRHGLTRIIHIPTENLANLDAKYIWPDPNSADMPEELSERFTQEESRFELDGVVRSVRFTISNLDIKQRQMTVELVTQLMNSEGQYIADSGPINQVRFKLDHFAFPLEDNMILTHDHRLALSIDYFSKEWIGIRVQLFRHIQRGSGLTIYM